MAFGAAIASGACAHTMINAQRQDAYFSCPNVQVGQAEANLAAAGWPIENASENSVTTEFRPIDFKRDTELVIPLRAREGVQKEKVSQNYSVRVTVGRMGTGVRFHLYQKIVDRTVELDPIFHAQIEHEETRRELNSYRMAVCGGLPFFGH